MTLAAPTRAAVDDHALSEKRSPIERLESVDWRTHRAAFSHAALRLKRQMATDEWLKSARAGAAFARSATQAEWFAESP